jgi:hypothetical protein
MFKQPLTLLVFIIMSIVSPACPAGDSVSISPSRVREFSVTDVRMPDRDYFNPYLNNKAYQYGNKNGLQERDGFIGRLFKKAISLWRLWIKALNYLPFVLQIVFYVLCLMALFLLITKTRIYRLFYSGTEIKNPVFSESDPLIEKYDFNEAIASQLFRKNFRNAIRLLHLKVLKEMESKGIINFSREKTNKEYGREITDTDLRQSFFKLASVYNRIWFGNYNLPEDEYETLSKGFYQFSEELNAKEE